MQLIIVYVILAITGATTAYFAYSQFTAKKNGCCSCHLKEKCDNSKYILRNCK